MFNEKIYMFLWIWLLLVGVCTSFNFLYWLITSIPSCFRFRFIHKYLRIAADEPFNLAERELIQKFVSKCLRSDGVLLMRFISGHTGDMLLIELVFRLFQHYVDRVNSNQEEKDHIKMKLFSTADYTPRIPPTAPPRVNGEPSGFSEVIYNLNSDDLKQQQAKSKVRPKSLAQQRWLECSA